MGLCVSKPSGSPRYQAAYAAEQHSGPSSPPSGTVGHSSPHGLSALASPNASGSMAPRAQVGLVKLNTHKLEEQKQQLLERIKREGPDFRTTAEERAQFKTAFMTLWGNERPDMRHWWDATMRQMEQMKRQRPELKDVKVEDLVALKAWTTDDYEAVQDVLDRGTTPTAQGLAFAKCIVSALHSLPASYSHQGTVFTGEDQLPEWVADRHQEGETKLNRRFFATSETREGAWPGMAVEWETVSRRGKRISMFSDRPAEKEVLFPPGTQFRVDRIEENESHPLLKIYQTEVVL